MQGLEMGSDQGHRQGYYEEAMRRVENKMPIYKSTLFSPVMKLELTKQNKNLLPMSKDFKLYSSTQAR